MQKRNLLRLKHFFILFSIIFAISGVDRIAKFDPQIEENVNSKSLGVSFHESTSLPSITIERVIIQVVNPVSIRVNHSNNTILTWVTSIISVKKEAFTLTLTSGFALSIHLGRYLLSPFHHFG